MERERAAGAAHGTGSVARRRSDRVEASPILASLNYLLNAALAAPRVSSLRAFSKPSRRLIDDRRYIGFEIPDRFVVGTGWTTISFIESLRYVAALTDYKSRLSNA
jgi:hypoxanthine-guanine phosphoribosyltransferase